MLGWRARADLDLGDWSAAAEAALEVLSRKRAAAVTRITTLAVLARVRVRRGDPGVPAALEEAQSLAAPTGELQRIGPVACAGAEAAWLDGDAGLVARITDPVLELALRRRARWTIDELSCWRRRAGIEDDPPADAADPYLLELSGDWARAAEAWERIGCPYQRALALASSEDEHALQTALAELERLGANPVAERLIVAEKTVDHHVSAILRKLGVRNRGEASAEGVRRGLIAPAPS